MGKTYHTKPKITKNKNDSNTTTSKNIPAPFVSSVSYPRNKTVVAQLEEVVAKYPEKIAFVFEEDSLTFGELNEKSNQIAAYLVNKGISPESLVPFCMEKSIDMLVTIFGILKAGGAYVPIDPNYPLERIQYILEDTGASLLLVNNSLDKKLNLSDTIDLVDYASFPMESIENFISKVKPTPENLAYVIYTSGSTGRPKGVMVPHRGLMDHCFGLIESANLKDCESYAVTAPIVFDAGHSLIHTAVIQAATIHLLSDRIILDSEKITAYLEHQKIDCLKIVPSLWLSHTESGLTPVPQRKLIFGGENFPKSIIPILRKSGFKGDVFNHYGPTEASIGKCIYQIDLNRTYSRVPIGKPFSNTFILLLNSKHEKVGKGEVGEIYIGGDGIARGYLNLPLVTAKNFIPDFISGKNGGFLYRTGDLGKTSEDGNLLYQGRVDDQVKINGYRIEPGEIEACIYQFESIKQIAVVPKCYNQKFFLIAYFVFEKGRTEEGIKDKLKTKLPAHMIPQYWIQMEEMPLTSNGKIDKKALPEPEWTASQTSKNPPQTETEKILFGIWQKLLSWNNIGINDNFFDLGGDSLLAIRSIAAIKNSLGKRLMMKDFFDFPTISALSEVIDKKKNDLDVIAPSKEVGFIPLSFNQEALWIIHNAAGSLQYHLPMVFNISGDLDIQSLKASLKEIVKRHLPLRTIIHPSNKGLEQKFLTPESWTIQEFITQQTTEETINDWPFKSMIERPFDLTKDFMIRAALFHIEPKEHLFCILVHHIAWDGWSTVLFKNELALLYDQFKQGVAIPDKSSILEYSDFSIYQRSLLRGDLLKQSLSQWRKNLEGVIPSQLRTDFPRTLEVNTAGSSHSFTISRDTTAKLKSLAKKHNATLFMVLLAGFYALLKRHSSQEDICIGIPTTGREHEGLDALIGYFVNTLPVRTMVNGTSSFEDLLKQVKSNTLEAFDHGDVPFSEIVKLSEDFRFSGRNPIFQVLFVMQNNLPTELILNGLKTTPLKIFNDVSSFELTLEIKEADDQLHAVMNYQSALFSASTIARMSDHLVELLKSAVLTPQETIDNINLLNAKERDFILNPDTDFALSDDLEKATVLNLIDEQVKLFPQKTAIRFNENEVSYAELDKQSNKVANYLINQGVKIGALVPICLDNSPQMILGILGILKAGAAYIPIDPTFPKDRIKFILEDANATWVITDQDKELLFRENFINLSILTLDTELSVLSEENADKPNKVNSSENTAYLIYTSGTTGKPKGVMISHKSLFLSTHSRNTYYPDKTAVLLIQSFSFDSSIAVIFGALTTGSELVLGRAQQLKNPKELKKLLTFSESILCVPSFYRFLLSENLISGSQIKRVILGGERLEPSLVASHFEKNEGAKLYNEYGPTEGTVWTTVCELTSPNDPISIGKPIPHAKVYVIDPSGNICPIGIQGELCIGGQSLAKGYLNLSDLTAASFVSDPYSKIPGSRMYKTGDKARLLHNGNLEFLGRLDNQVKLRGYRIELEEIEALVEQLDFVNRAIVSINGESSDNQRLVGNLTTGSNFNHLSEEQKTRELNAHLAVYLPVYMIPNHWVFLKEMPLTAIGKIDRKKLSKLVPQPSYKTPTPQSESPTEKKLINIWKALLKIDQVEVHDNFFKIGGHSLLAIRLINAIREHFKYEIKFNQIFHQPTIHELALLINEQTSTPPLSNPITNASRAKVFPLSFGQESLWLTDRLEGSQHYHIPLVLKLKGNLYIPSLEATLKAILTRHEVLRSTYRYDGEHVYQEVQEFADWHLEVNDLLMEKQSLPDIIQEQTDLPFDLTKEAMFRALLIRQSDAVNVLIMTFHHIAFDGWSVGLLMNELKSFYLQHKNQNKIEGAPLPIQFGDYAIWQREQFQGNAFETKIDFWKTKLRGVQPTNISKSNNDSDAIAGQTKTFIIPLNVAKKLTEMANSTGTTLYMVLMATFKTLLYQLSEKTDLCIGTVVADRQNQHTDRLLGYFINTLPIRSRLNPETSFLDFLSEVKFNCLEAFEYQDVPFEKIVAAAKPERKLGNNPIFQVMFLIQNTLDDNEWQIDDLRVEKIDNNPQIAKFDLTYTVKQTENELKGLFEYKTSLFGEDEMAKIIKDYLHLLETICQQPSVPISQFSKVKQQIEPYQPLVKPNKFKEEFKSVQLLIEAAALQFSGKAAIISKDESCTYKTLNETSNQLADLLVQNGIGRNDIVGIVMDRSINMILSIMAVLKAGAAYLPIDTDFPEERINYMLKDAAKVHITHRKYNGKFKSQSKEILWEEFINVQESFSKENPSPNNEAHDPGYIIYTSGSTGKPKGVILTHGNLYNFLKTVSDQPGIVSENKFLAVSSASFDIALLELILPFVHGAQIVILDQYERKDPRVILKYLTQKKADIMFATPTHWKMLLESGWDATVENLQIISGGEALSKELAKQLLPLCHSLWNIYGPTETTVFSTIKKVEADQSQITIGREVLNTKIYLLDENKKPVPKGTEGEIYISGKGVAKGYLNQPELTSQKFTRDPFKTETSEIMYKTGDRAKLLANGEIQILGRIDNQIKLRGHRIELEEIEQALNMLYAVKQSIVLFRNTSSDDKGLVAYLLLKNDFKEEDITSIGVTSAQVRSWKKELSKTLPGYMLPYDFVIVDHFPHTASGKIDRLKLPDPIALDQNAIVPPQTDEEKKIAEIWKEALRLKEIDITDNFFEIGGHSLIAVKVMTLIEKEMGKLLPLSILFKYPTIEQLAAFLKTKVVLNKEWKSLVPIQPKGKKAPIYLVHGAGLNVLPFQALAKHFEHDQPIYGIQSKGMNAESIKYESIEEIAASYIAEIVQNNPSGKIILGGYSLGGIIAFEMAKQLKGTDIAVDLLLLLDSFATFSKGKHSPQNRLFAKLHREFNKKSFDLKLLTQHPGILRDIKSRSISKKIDALLLKLRLKIKEPESPIIERINNIKAMHVAACKNYSPGLYEGEIVMLRAKIRTKYFHDPQNLGWKGLSKSMRIIEVEGIHSDLFSEPYDGELASRIKEVIDGTGVSDQ
ncbi:non-ribosomal peptide synthetase [Cyclobacterium qasimii]|uniref:Long-chain-fatty-acid--CoA ligase n=2 Tax=Cyclobacterium qasimii TaxID=1350429 RepID=S7V9J4_9BACT|nr:non-ribosomal peptide synthetase [Cyclobacterium qasimii]EPR66935.1 Long-chain-fatty-acid--CoA ligase [Cyclobacterium qasimii M12-11B]GEO20190.1 hypothetical protein CQA01_07240 [Cyclobacterium qasimii]